MSDISLSVNGRPVSGMVEPRTHLADFLRDGLHMTGTHLRCEQGVCGACTLLVDGEPARACITYAVQCRDAEITTIEGLQRDPVTERLREAFMTDHGLQCGFCTPGMLVTARDIVIRLPDADAARVREELSGNLCRCTGYAGIVRAICRVLDERRAGAFAAPPAGGRIGPVGARARSAAEPVARQEAVSAANDPAAATPVTQGELGLGGRQPNLETQTSFAVQRPAAEVWAAFADIERTARCLPGATVTALAGDGLVHGKIAVRIGPIATDFNGSARIERDEELRRGIVHGAGRDQLSGSGARAEIVYGVEQEGPNAARVALTIRALLSGPLAQFGRNRIVDQLVDRLAADFARRLESMLEHGDEAPLPEASPFRPWALIRGLVADRFGRIFARRSKEDRP